MYFPIKMMEFLLDSMQSSAANTDANPEEPHLRSTPEAVDFLQKKLETKSLQKSMA